MTRTQQVMRAAREAGFTEIAPLDVSTIVLMPEVRAMCASDACHKYAKSWACPPGCGTLEECRARLGNYDAGVLVQTVGQLEDCWDFEGMKKTEQLHKNRFFALVESLAGKLKILPVSTGTCTRCAECTYPDAPCRFPDKAMSSMEAYGMLVNDVCKANGMAYNHGPDTVCYTSCVLFRAED